MCILKELGFPAVVNKDTGLLVKIELQKSNKLHFNIGMAHAILGT
jgi:hypothetical protein